MTARSLVPDDLEQLIQLHEKHYSEFGFPVFLQMLNAFVIEDKGEIIMAGGVESVGEVVLVTDKDKPRVTIGRALLEARQIAEFTAKHFGIKELYAFVNNDDYAKHLIQHGFQDHPHRALSMRVK